MRARLPSAPPPSPGRTPNPNTQTPYPTPNTNTNTIPAGASGIHAPTVRRGPRLRYAEGTTLDTGGLAISILHKHYPYALRKSLSTRKRGADTPAENRVLVTIRSVVFVTITNAVVGCCCLRRTAPRPTPRRTSANIQILLPLRLVKPGYLPVSKMPSAFCDTCILEASKSPDSFALKAARPCASSS